MMIVRHQTKSHIWARRCWQFAFALLLSMVLVLEAVPELSASALYLITDGFSTAVMGGTAPVSAERILLADSTSADTDVILEPERKVAITHGDALLYATSREGESVSELLRREGVAVGDAEIVRVDLSDDMIRLEIASDFTYYEIETEAAAYGTVYETDYTLPKGETRVTRAGQAGVREVTYEVVYADGAFVSRQAVAEEDDGVVDEVVSTGTLVREAQEGDTIREVVRNDDGSGYLLMESGDSLHFTGTMEVSCTAYTSSERGVGTITATGTTVHVGVVAVDKSVIPLGTRMFITTTKGDITYGMGHAEDTGVRGKVVDLYMDSYNECIQFGRRSSTVYFLDD